MSNGKTCIYCGQDCSAKPRVKDPQGRYACKSCAEAAARPKPAHRQPEPDAANDEFDIFAGLGEAEGAAAGAVASGPAIRAGCPNCGVVMDPGAVVCMRCGYNAQTGGKISTKVGKIKDPKPEEHAERRMVSYGWVGMLVALVAAVALPAVGASSEAAFGGAILAAAGWFLVAWIMMIVAAFQDGEGKWGIIGICSVIPCLGGIAGLAFTLYYCIFGSERPGWKLNYWCALGAAVALQIVGLTQYPDLINQYR